MSRRTVRARRAQFGGRTAVRAARGNAPRASNLSAGAESAGFEGYVTPTPRAASEGSSTAGTEGWATPRTVPARRRPRA